MTESTRPIKRYYSTYVRKDGTLATYEKTYKYKTSNGKRGRKKKTTTRILELINPLPPSKQQQLLEFLQAFLSLDERCRETDTPLELVDPNEKK